MKKRILGVSNKRFFLYFISLIIGVLFSFLFIILGFYFDDSLINYFLGFSASSIITVIFAYLIDLINQQEKIDIEKAKRSIYIQPISMKIVELFHRVMLLSIGAEERDIEYTFDDFEKCFQKVFSDYCRYLSLLIGENKPLLEVNAAFNIKDGIQKWVLKDIVQNIDSMMNNLAVIKIEGLFDDGEIYSLQRLKQIVENLYLPYLDTLNLDKNTAKSFVDWPKAEVNDIVKNNYRVAIVTFVDEVKQLAKTFNEFAVLKDLKFKYPIF